MADAKPATDEQIAEWKRKYKAANGFYGSTMSAEVGPLIARINQECAQVRKLKAALRVIAKAELYDPVTGIIDADVLAICQQEARVALKEPSND